MGSFRSFQRKQRRASSESAPPSSIFQPVRPFEPVPTPGQEQQGQVAHASDVGYAIANLPIHYAGAAIHGQEAETAVTQRAVSGDQADVRSEEAGTQDRSRPNSTGLPDNVKAGVENLSGLPLDDVRVYYNSAQPAGVQALAYTQGTEIFVAPGQEQHVAHEAWHVVQQKQGRVKPTIQAKGMAINDDSGLEREADEMGTKAASTQATDRLPAQQSEGWEEAGTLAPSVRPSAVQLVPVAQRYAEAGSDKTSQNELYVVDSTTETILYVKDGAPPPRPTALIVANGSQTQIDGEDYDQYHYDPSRNFTNDCLAFAENLARGTDVDSTRHGEFRAVGDRPGGADRLFGVTDAQNVDIAQGGWVENEAANPAIGEAYATARPVMPIGGETPYHIATVIAKDGSDNVTLEADASDPQRVLPIFDMYDTVPPHTRTDPDSLTFHETYEDTYTSERGKGTKRVDYEPATGVLRARDD